MEGCSDDGGKISETIVDASEEESAEDINMKNNDRVQYRRNRRTMLT